MLLPEANRNSLPYLVSVTIQCSLVLLLAIPWTVQSLRTAGSIQTPTILILQNPKPMEVVKASHAESTVPGLLSALPRRARIFTFSRQPSNAPTSVTVDAPDLGFEVKGPFTGGAAIFHPSEDLARLASAPVPTPLPPNTAGSGERLEVGGNIQAAKLVHRVQPAYPSLARQVRVQGVVTLEAIISKDGKIQQLHVLSGHPLLVPSAVEAVQQWVYSPTILNGKAVEVKTTIDVRFTLSER